MTKTGILIGRFQTPAISGDLRRTIEDLKSEYDRFALIVGVSKIKASANNPYSKSMRVAMLKEAFPDVEVLTIDDHPLDEVWSKNLDDLVSEKFKDASVTLFGSADNFVSNYRGRFDRRALGDLINPKADLGALEQNATLEFREGVLWAAQSSYPKVFATVDVALFRKRRSELLLGFKEADKKWRLPGGFTDPDDESFEAAAARELQEETGVKLEQRLNYEGSFKIDDWRYRKEKDKIITTMFSAEIDSAEAVASDDLAELRWFSLDEISKLLSNGETAAEHQPLFQFLLDKYAK